MRSSHHVSHEHEGGWSPVSAAPRDGTPVILWLAEDDAPPVLRLTVGSGQSSLKQASAIGGSSEIPHPFAPIGKSADGSRGFTAEISNADPPKRLRLSPGQSGGEDIGTCETRHSTARLRNPQPLEAASDVVPWASTTVSEYPNG